MLKILFLAANPLDTERLQLDEEVRSIDEALRKSQYRDRIELTTHWAVRVDDLQSLLLRHQPHIVHFSGHGSEANEIVLQDHNGQSVMVPPVALGMLFNTQKDNIRCVVLNACYSAGQAGAIAQYIDCVVGMSDAIGDMAARQYAASFYQGLAYGRTIAQAHNLGVVQIALYGTAEEHKPQLLGAANPADVRLVDPAEVEREERAMNTQINTGGGAYIGGGVQLSRGDFVGRDKIVHGDEIRGDKVEGDKVMGDKNTGDSYSIGNISNAKGIAIGRKAQATVREITHYGTDGEQLAQLFAPLLAQVEQAAPAEKREAAVQKVEALQEEAAKGDDADDNVMGNLLADLAELVPSAVGAIGSIFAGPVLGGAGGASNQVCFEAAGCG